MSAFETLGRWFSPAENDCSLPVAVAAQRTPLPSSSCNQPIRAYFKLQLPQSEPVHKQSVCQLCDYPVAGL